MEEKKIKQQLNHDEVNEVQKTFAEWGKYLFVYYPQERKVEPSAYVVQHMDTEAVITDMEDNLLTNKLTEKQKLLDLLSEIDGGSEYASETLQSTETNKFYKVSLHTVKYDEVH